MRDLLKNFRNVLEKHSSNLILDSEIISNGQIDSKCWLIDELERLDLDLGNTAVVGGWYGVLSALLFESKLKFNNLMSVDRNPSCASVAEDFNKTHVLNGRFTAVTADMYEMDYSNINTVINTSCEHLPSIQGWVDLLPEGMLVVAQSNNYFEWEDHISCSESLEHFNSLVNLKEKLFVGELQLYAFKRFMMIGYR